MKRILTSLAILALVTGAANAAVYINEVLPNSPGSDTGNEYFELRGTPNMSLAGYYLLNLGGLGQRERVMSTSIGTWARFRSARTVTSSRAKLAANTRWPTRIRR